MEIRHYGRCRVARTDGVVGRVHPASCSLVCLRLYLLAMAKQERVESIGVRELTLDCRLQIVNCKL